MSETLAQALQYFEDGAATRHPGATEEMIAAAEKSLGASFPPSYREFLKLHNGLVLPEDEIVLGVPSLDQVINPSVDRTPLDIVGYTLLHRRYQKEPSLLVITTNGTGANWALLLDQADENGEGPVAEIDHETSELLYGGSTFERFLWFHLERMQRLFERDGTPKQAYYQWIQMVPDDWEADEDPEWMDDEPYLPWPHADLAWILEHDPALARHRPADQEEGS